MKFLKRKYAEFKEDKAKEKAIDKKIKQAQEGQKIAADKKNLLEMGLSDEEADFKARKNLKKAKRKEKVDSLVSGVSGAVDVLSMEMGVGPEDVPPKKKSSTSKGKKKQNSNSKKKKGGKGGGSNPLHMDLPGFEL